MAIRFNKLIIPGGTNFTYRFIAESHVRGMAESDIMVFLSHKTGDEKAEDLAIDLSKTHKIKVFMAEWDDHVHGDSDQLPDYIIEAIGKSRGFLVHVTQEIRASMWIGYEIGAAHAMKKERAKVVFSWVERLPSVVDVLEGLQSKNEIDDWIKRKIL